MGRSDLICCHAVSELSDILALLGFAEDEKVFVHNQVESIFAGRGSPASCRGTVVLDLDNIFFENKPGFQKHLHHPIGQRNEMSAAACVPD